MRTKELMLIVAGALALTCCSSLGFPAWEVSYAVGEEVVEATTANETGARMVFRLVAATGGVDLVLLVPGLESENRVAAADITLDSGTSATVAGAVVGSGTDGARLRTIPAAQGPKELLRDIFAGARRAEILIRGAHPAGPFTVRVSGLRNALIEAGFDVERLEERSRFL